MGAALTRARHLLRARNRRADRRALVEGPHLFDEVLRAGAVLHEVFTDAAEAALTCDRLAAAGHDRTPVHVIDERELREITDAETPRVPVVVVSWPEPPASPLERGTWVVLDAVQDPGNVGTLLRAAAAFGVAGVVAARGTADVWSPKVIRAGQGAHFHVPVVSERGGDVELDDERISAWAEEGRLWVAAADGTPVYESTAEASTDRVLVLGNEARGVSERFDRPGAVRVAVPQSRRVESLNVAMAGSVLMSWLDWSASRSTE